MPVARGLGLGTREIHPLRRLAEMVTFDREVVNQQVEWEQRCGIVQRGRPNTLVLHRLRPMPAKLRAPGPGAVRKVEWAPLAKNGCKIATLFFTPTQPRATALLCLVCFMTESSTRSFA